MFEIGFFVLLFILLVLLPYLFTSSKKRRNIKRFDDIYKSLDEVSDALRKEGLESSNLIVGIDYTASNLDQGRKTFQGKCLHTIETDLMNPYQCVIRILGQTLAKFDEDGYIPVFGFGDISTKDFSVFPMTPNTRENVYCRGFEDVLKVYELITPSITFSGPTNFAPLIEKGIEICRNNNRFEYHILIIIADGQVIQEQDTINSIVQASQYPLSIICVGVGDGPWEMMEKFDDRIPQRTFDNFQFVNFSKVMEEARRTNQNPEVAFALAALQEIPQQYNAIKQLGLLGRRHSTTPIINNQHTQYQQQQQEQQLPQLPQYLSHNQPQ